MDLILRRKWLSAASKREFLKVLPFRDRVGRWFDERKEDIRSRCAFITIVVLIIALHIVIPLFPPIWASLVTPSEIRSFISTLWPVHAAIVAAT